MLKLRNAIATMLVLAIKQNVGAQGFINLNFESANISNSTALAYPIPISDGLPGWNGYFTSGTNPYQVTQVTYDGLSLAGATISINDSNTPVFGPISGRYSAMLFGGAEGDGLASASISQTGLVPSGTESLLFDAHVSGALFTVTLGGQTIAMQPLQTFFNYTLYGGNIPSDLAGQSETLMLTEPPAVGAQPSMFELDNIQFSNSSVPEPSAFGLTALCGIFIASRRYNRQNVRLLPTNLRSRRRSQT